MLKNTEIFGRRFQVTISLVFYEVYSRCLHRCKGKIFDFKYVSFHINQHTALEVMRYLRALLKIYKFYVNFETHLYLVISRIFCAPHQRSIYNCEDCGLFN